MYFHGFSRTDLHMLVKNATVPERAIVFGPVIEFCSTWRDGKMPACIVLAQEGETGRFGARKETKP
jgi:hypothetical protein